MDEDEFQQPSLDSDIEFSSAISSAALDFDSSMRFKFDEVIYKKIRTIGAFIMRGLSLEEACILSRIIPSRLTAMMEEHDDVKAFILFKQTAYKAALLKTLSVSATDGLNMKSAGYLLEKQFASEYGKKSKDDTDRPLDMLEAAIEFVRENSDASPIVSRLPEPKTG